MFAKVFEFLRSIPLTKSANIINWVGFTPIAIGGVLASIFDNERFIFHWIPLSASAILGFGYAVLLSLDSSNELFQRRPLFDGVSRWLWRWICAGWGALMLVIMFFMYIRPL